MKQQIEYTLKIDFKTRTENPSRIFNSMGSLIDSFKDVDLMLARAIDTKLDFKQLLESIEVSSLISKIMDELTFSDQPNLGEDNDSKQLSNYFDYSRNRIIQKINKNEKIDNMNVIEELENELYEAANQSGIAQSVKYSENEKYLLIRNINSLSNSVKSLNEDENAIYTDQQEKLQINKNCIIDTEKLHDMLTEEVLESETTLILKIKKPDFLGESRWEFKHGKNPIFAKITNKEWLEDFRNGKVPLVPGDAIKARMKEIVKYDKKGNVISTYQEITEILNLIHNIENNQIDVFQ